MAAIHFLRVMLCYKLDCFVVVKFTKVLIVDCHVFHCRPAYCGATKGQTETLRLLVQHGADIWLANIKGDVPLHEAVASGRKDLVLWLLRQWGNEEIQRQHRASSASITLERRANSVNQDAAPITNGAAQVVNADGRSPLHVAAINNNVEMCKVT